MAATCVETCDSNDTSCRIGGVATYTSAGTYYVSVPSPATTCSYYYTTDLTSSNSSTITTIEYTYYYDSMTGARLSYAPGIEYTPIQIKESKKDLMRNKIREQLRPKVSEKSLKPSFSQDEERARRLLRSLIGEERFKKYLRRGLVVEHGKTGLKYAIRPGHEMIRVYHPRKDGKHFLFRRLCIVPKDCDLPPTDSVIMRILLIRNDEFAMQKLANVFPVSTPSAEDADGVSNVPEERVA